jgi:NitT/TauT family transport system ATP-binding protein
MEEAILCRGVSKQFPGAETTTLRDLSFSVSAAEFVCLIGPSGCGKSTALRLVAGLDHASSGEVRVQGRPVVDCPPGLAMVFQSGALLPWRTVLENVSLGLELQGQRRVVWERAARDSLAMVGLESYAAHLPRDLSGGMRQRVGVARALVTNPQILLLDEPTSALDPQTAAALHRDLLRIWQERHMTILMVSHSLEETLALADRVIVLGHGKVVKQVTIPQPRPRDLHANSLRQLHQQLEHSIEEASNKSTQPIR